MIVLIDNCRNKNANITEKTPINTPILLAEIGPIPPVSANTIFLNAAVDPFVCSIVRTVRSLRYSSRLLRSNDVIGAKHFEANALAPRTIKIISIDLNPTKRTRVDKRPATIGFRVIYIFCMEMGLMSPYAGAAIPRRKFEFIYSENKVK